MPSKAKEVNQFQENECSACAILYSFQLMFGLSELIGRRQSLRIYRRQRSFLETQVHQRGCRFQN